ncbi:MAG: methyltransferase domain-containing protein [Candidatus Freyarchaeota archaeon]|nr:methyltransferase domain-containing protein [Candidatus Jordarchaeia archaeon]
MLAERMRLKPGMIVVEVGPGKGSYTKTVAEKILPGGIVYAINIQKSLIERLKKRVGKWRITNIIPKIDDAYNLSFADESVDRILAVCTLAEIPEPVKALREFHKVLKPEGLVCLSEFFTDPDYPKRSTEKRWASEAGSNSAKNLGTSTCTS